MIGIIDQLDVDKEHDLIGTADDEGIAIRCRSAVFRNHPGHPFQNVDAAGIRFGEAIAEDQGRLFGGRLQLGDVGFEPFCRTLQFAGVELLGSGIRTGAGLYGDWKLDAEPEYVAAAGEYLFVTLQESNTVARIDLSTNQVDAYIGLGWVD